VSPWRAGRLVGVGALALSLLLVAAGCPEERGVPSAMPEEDPNLPPARVNLPPVPDLTGPATPLRLADGSYTVWGLHSQAGGLVGKDVTVQALVVEVYHCPDPPPEGVKCQAPHFWISDSQQGKPARMMVVGYDPEDEDTPEPEAGKRITLLGVFDRRNEQGFVASEGLVRMASWKEIEEDAAATSGR